MSKYYNIHIENPQQRSLLQIVTELNQGAVVAVPTDGCYAICCRIDDKNAEKRMLQLRNLSDKDNHLLALLMADISQASHYAKVGNWAFKILKKATPGAYTFILPASVNLPKRLHLKRKTIGIRIPDNKILLDLLKLYNQPLYSSTLWQAGDDFPYFEPELIKERFEHKLDIIIDGGVGSPEMSTIVSLLDNKLEILRPGKGNIDIFNI
ncbi:MAG: threonylcarbamoyl-AMP synthase [Gammaproteobacteria bacterium]|nr:threonylcarbamoyl-AMP synthase [Gammaproteobacteria bacterium]